MKQIMIVVAVVLVAFAGCVRNGSEPDTVSSVKIDRYVGKWYEISSNPVFFNKNLVGVTAEYGIVSDTEVTVLNTGYVRSLDGRKRTISGAATVVDKTTNAKLEVRFDTFFGALFRGSYWIVLLDDEENEADVPYQYAVVTDNRQFTMFVLSRTPDMDGATYNRIVDTLKGRGIDTSRLRVTGTIT